MTESEKRKQEGRISRGRRGDKHRKERKNENGKRKGRWEINGVEGSRQLTQHLPWKQVNEKS